MLWKMIVCSLPSFSLSSLASPYETFCHMLPILGAAEVQLLNNNKKLSPPIESFDLETMPILCMVLQFTSQMLSFFTVRHILFLLHIAQRTSLSLPVWEPVVFWKTYFYLVVIWNILASNIQI